VAFDTLMPGPHGERELFYNVNINWLTVNSLAQILSALTRVALAILGVVESSRFLFTKDQSGTRLWQEWGFILTMWIYLIFNMAGEMFTMITPVYNLATYQTKKEVFAVVQYLMPGDFLIPPTKQELADIDPTLPTAFDIFEVQNLEGIFWFYI
jgi:hypothetical protein